MPSRYFRETPISQTLLSMRMNSHKNLEQRHRSKPGKMKTKKEQIEVQLLEAAEVEHPRTTTLVVADTEDLTMVPTTAPTMVLITIWVAQVDLTVAPAVATPTWEEAILI
jgi:hypothetical protein